MKYLYIIDIDFDDKEIIFTRSDKLMWSLIPSSPERLSLIIEDYPDYSFAELDERLLLWLADGKSIMSPN